MGEAVGLGDNTTSSKQALSLLERYRQASEETDSFLARLAQKRSQGWARETASKLTERGILHLAGSQRGRTLRWTVSRPVRTDLADMILRQRFKALFDPADLILAAADAKGGWYKVMSHNVAGVRILASISTATPIGLTFQASLFVYEVVTDLIEWKERRDAAKAARDYDLRMHDIVRATGKIRRQLTDQLLQTEDVKAYAKQGPGVGVAIVNYLTAAKIVTPTNDPDTQRRFLRQAHSYASSWTFLEHALRYLRDQQISAMAGQVHAALLARAFEEWASNPDELLGQIARDVPYADRQRWYDERDKLLPGYARQFAELQTRFEAANRSLEGELFLVSLIMAGAAAYTADAVQPRYQKQGLEGYQ